MSFRMLPKMLCFAAVLLSLSEAFAQTPEKLYTPLNIQKAYLKGTRSVTGEPGKNYWQNSADYFIEAELNPSTRMLKGKEKITYYNNSPDTLKKLVVRLYQDFYRSTAARDFPVTTEYLTDGVEISSIKINGSSIDQRNDKSVSRSMTNMNIIPPAFIQPQSSVLLEIEWKYTVPGGRAIRTGVYDSTTFFIAYWYPQISVYDDISGWDEFNFGGEKEFYNDINNFDVKISVPAGSGVWATGNLINPDEVLNEPWYSRYIQSLQSDSVINIIRKEDLNEKIYKSNGQSAVWHFRAQGVPDFAFGTSSHYLWDAVSLKPDSLSVRRSHIAAAYRETSQDFYKVADIARQTLIYFSQELPGVPYPYPSLIIFNGSGGMEFPMIINNGSVSAIEDAVRLTSHEAAHQYFPFYAGTNERKYAWMDEGWAVMIPFEFQERNKKPVRSLTAAAYEIFAGNELDLPPMVPSVMTTGHSYRNAAYNRPANAYNILLDILGKEKFRKALQLFISRWNGKHPVPYDLFYTFDAAAGEDLSWFWKPWFFESGYPDLFIKEVKAESKNISITIGSKGSLPVPILLQMEGENGQSDIIKKSAEIWKNGQKQVSINIPINFRVKSVILGSDEIPDANRNDNRTTIP